MKFTLSWLKDHLDTDATLDQIVETLTMIGLEVEHVDDRSQFKPFTIARVISAEQHPDADRLRVLMVDKGDGQPVQVVCGAPNAKAGLVGAFAGPGDYIPGLDVTLSVGNIRGVESHGMMCSERELQMSDEHDGIIELAEDAAIGTSFAAHAGLDDPVIEIGITPNRPDALGVAGIARDLQAAGLGTVKTPPIQNIEGSYPCPVDVKLDFAGGDSLCQAFGLRLVRNINNGPSPKWMQQRLMAIGQRPISALVDITNYMTFDRGRPLHVFDADKVSGGLTVRRGRDGEEVLALDDKTYRLGPKICVIADQNGVESIAGVMGGLQSGVDEHTKNVLIETALWQPLNIARTGRDLGIITDARYRFERGVDPAFMLPGLELATKLVLEFCDGEASDVQLVGEIPQPDLVIDFPLSEVRRLTGIEVDAGEICAILGRLGFIVDGQGALVKVLVPSWRPDVFGKADLVEEVMRIYGVDKIVSQPLPSFGNVGTKILTVLQIRTRSARRALASRGMMEAVSWTFIAKNQAQLFGGGSEYLALSNPIAADMSDMRPSLLPGLLAASQRNADRGVGDVALFEVSDIYFNDDISGQKRAAGGIRRNTAKPGGSGRNWAGNSSAVDVFDAKADALSVLAACGLDAGKVQIEAGGPDWYHPGRCGTIRLGPKNILATFGEFHPKCLKAMDVSGPVCGFEVILSALPEPKQKSTRTKKPLILSGLQAVRRDFSFVVDADVEAAVLMRAANGADKKLIADVSLFDVFEGSSLGVDKKSIAIEVVLQPQQQTLTDDQIEQVSARIIANVEKFTGGVLRGS